MQEKRFGENNDSGDIIALYSTDINENKTIRVVR